MRGYANRFGRGFLFTAATTLLAVAAITAQQSTTASRQGVFANSVPAALGPYETFAGTPWIASAPVTVTVAELMAREAAAASIVGPRAERHSRLTARAAFDRRNNPDAPAVAQWPPAPGADIGIQLGPHIAFNISTNFRGTRLAESGFIPPDSNGAVGPTQVLVTSNGRFKVFDKLGTLGTFNVSDQTFWSPVITVSPGGTFVSDPHVRYDRLSGRWFISEIDIPEPCECSNRILIAVSSGSTITDSSSFTLYFFQHDLVGTTPNLDTGGLADYDTLGVDTNALYIGVNEFDGSPSFNFRSSTGYVVRKAPMLTASPTVVTAFRGLLAPSPFFDGPYTPQGVDNDDPAANEGYFVGVDGDLFGRLAVRRITNPGTSPAISGNLFVTTPMTSDSIPQLAQGSIRPLDSVDFRLYAAMIKKNKLTGVSSLWTAHNIGVNASGVASSGVGTRNAGRWYQLDNLTTTPTLTQSGTVFDSSVSNAAGFWINTIAANGQGNAAIAQSWAGPTIPPSLAVFSRTASDPVGSMNNGQGLLGTAGYNVQTGGTAPQRWGDFSQVVVDPNDDMTMWTFQEYADAVNSWGVRAVKLQAPPPADVTIVSPNRVPRASSVNITVTGTSISGSGFFDPGPGFLNHISGTVSGGVTVNSATFIDATHVSLNLNTTTGTPGAFGRSVQITNPDGQASGPVFLLQVIGQTAGDFDGDGKADPTVFRPSTAGWYDLHSSTSYTSSGAHIWGASTDIPVPGDYDGDGKTDPAVFRPSTAGWYFLFSSTGYTTSGAVTWGASTDKPVPGDFDGDGKTDPAVFRPSTAGWYFLNSSTGYTTSGAVVWGASTDVPVSGDYDGDGKADPAVFRPSTGGWYFLKSSTSFTTSGAAIWGVGTDIAVPGDYDGDGRVDPTVFRPSTGGWYILHSNTSFTTSTSAIWGASTDIPVPGDYDGDGKTDPAIFRPSTGLWAMLRSSTGYTSSAAVTWGVGTDTPILKRP